MNVGGKPKSPPAGVASGHTLKPPFSICLDMGNKIVFAERLISQTAIADKYGRIVLSNSKFDLTKGSGLSSDTDFAKVERTEQ